MRGTSKRTARASERNEHRRKRVVLVVEDDKPIGDILVDAINDEAGYTAVRVGTASDALEALRAVPADLIVLDLRLPGMSGVELYDLLRSDERYRNVPVIFETATMRDYVAELRERGVAMYVKKPFDLNDLVSYVKRLAPPFPPFRPALPIGTASRP